MMDFGKDIMMRSGQEGTYYGTELIYLKGLEKIRIVKQF